MRRYVCAAMISCVLVLGGVLVTLAPAAAGATSPATPHSTVGATTWTLGTIPSPTTSGDVQLVGSACASSSSIPLDYVARQKLGGISLSFFILKQLPVIPVSAYSEFHTISNGRSH